MAMLTGSEADSNQILDESWYEIKEGTIITQGTLLDAFPLLIQPTSIPLSIEEATENPTRVKGTLTFQNVIVMTQACDLVAPEKADPIALCLRYDCKDIIANEDAPKSLRKENGWGALKGGNLIDYHLLHRHVHDVYGFDYQIIDLKHIYSVPFELVRIFLEKRKTHVDLKSPYREHLAYSFARRYMRIGLPLPIRDKYPY
jgi:hypothetical protein